MEGTLGEATLCMLFFPACMKKGIGAATAKEQNSSHRLKSTQWLACEVAALTGPIGTSVCSFMSLIAVSGRRIFVFCVHMLAAQVTGSSPRLLYAGVAKRLRKAI